MSQVTENNGKPHRNDSGTRHKVACIHDIVLPLLDECLHPNWVVTALLVAGVIVAAHLSTLIHPRLTLHTATLFTTYTSHASTETMRMTW